MHDASTRRRLAACWALAATAAALNATTGHAAAPPAGTPGATVWRCAGNSYSDRPCNEGRALESPTAPSDEQRRDADEATRNNLEAARSMERDRLRLEARQAGRGPLILDARPHVSATEPARSPRKKAKGTRAAKTHGVREDDFIASDPQAAARKKATRKAAGE